MSENSAKLSYNPPIHPESAPLESVLRTEELRHRPCRPADYEKENRALVALAEQLADSPSTVLQKLTDTMLEVFRAGSTGVSLLTKDGGSRFIWPAISGKWKHHIGGGTPRDFGPCGDVLDRNTTLLFGDVSERYTYFQPVVPPVKEALLIPFHVGGKAVGTIWAVSHDDHKFDAEDERLMKSLGKFASSAYQVLESIETLKTQAEQAQETGERLRTLADQLENQVFIRTAELSQRNAEVVQQSDQLRKLSQRLLQTQDDERRRIARELHDSAGQIVTALGMHLASIAKHALKPKIKKTAEESQEMVQQLSAEIRTLSYLLHPPLLDETGLSDAIQWYLEGLASRSSLKLELSIPKDFGRLPQEMEVTIFRVIQECLTNIHRHSGSKTGTIRLWRAEDRISLAVQDSGSGMSMERLAALQAQRSGVGIAGMRERVRHLNGTLDIQSGSNGTTISVTFPMPTLTNSNG